MLLKDMVRRRDCCYARSKAHIRSESLSILLDNLVPKAPHENLSRGTYVVSILLFSFLSPDGILSFGAFQPIGYPKQKSNTRSRNHITLEDRISPIMNNCTHFQNQTGSLFSRLECQLACALHIYVRTRRHRHSWVDHSQPPTLEMLEEILRVARLNIWNEARRRGAPCNAMPPYAHSSAYCLVRNLRFSPSHHRWYDDVLDHPDVWRPLADQVFNDWIRSRSPLVYEYVLLFIGIFFM